MSQSGDEEKPITANCIEPVEPINNCIEAEDPVNNCIEAEDPVNNCIEAENPVNNCIEAENPVNNCIEDKDSVNNCIEAEDPVNCIEDGGPICSKRAVIKLERLNAELVETLLKALNEKLKNSILNEDGSRHSKVVADTDHSEDSEQSEERTERRTRHKGKKKDDDKRRTSKRTGGSGRKLRGSGEGDEVSNIENGDDDSESEDGQRRSKRIKAVAKSSASRKKRRRFSSDAEFKVKEKSKRRSKYQNDSDREFEELLNDKKTCSESQSESSYLSEETGSEWSGGVSERRRRRKKKRVGGAETVYSEFAKTIIGNGKSVKCKEEHLTYCQKCKKGGELICCLTCKWSFHLLCLNPPLKEIPDGKWQCPRCTAEELPGKPLSMVGWRWKESKEERENFTKLTAEEQKLAAKPQKEYFIHWTDESFWKCSWVSEAQLKYSNPVLLRGFEKNADSDEEETCILGNSNDPLHEKFYKYGVLPQWLTVHRIISHQKVFGKIKYLVKWRGVPYNEASWEKENNKEIPEFNKFQQIYHDWEMIFKGDEDYEFKHIHPPPKTPTSDLSVAFTEQPLFVDTAAGFSLHDYQLQSLNWLRESWKRGVNTILADEMGLGKTIQAIVFLYSLYKEGHCTGPFLVVAPLSTVMNWEREFELWAPDMYVVTYTGIQEERIVIRNTELSNFKMRPTKQARKIRGSLKFHVLLTSYEYVTKEVTTLKSLHWAAMVVDEGHRLKNNRSKFFDLLNNYETDYKLILSGTPLQNNITELFNMLNFLCPDDNEEMDALQEQFDNDEISNEEQVKKLQSLLSSHLLRRVKEDVLKDLPTKSEIIVKVELSPMQKKYYKYILTKNFEALNSKSGGHWATLMFVIVDLQKCCNHPYLFSSAMMKAPVLPSDIYETGALVRASGKLSLLQKMLRQLHTGGHRVLIFSHSIKMLDILEDFFEGEKYEYERIDGSISGAERQKSIDRFNAPNSQVFVFLLSTKAGGLGINLATADTVILYDSDWNPHNDVQAFSRAHRIGQTKKVMIYRFITRHSIEERIVHVARKKLMLNQVILESRKGDLGLALSKQQLSGIIRYGTKELFKEDAEYVRDNYTDEAINDLLDRTKMDVKEEKQENDNALLSSVKIVSHVTAEDVVEIDSSEDENKDADYWQKMMGDRCHQKKWREVRPGPMGKGGRRRKRVSYKVPGEDDPFSSSDEGDVEVIDIDSDSDDKKSDSDVQVIESDEDGISSINRPPLQPCNGLSLPPVLKSAVNLPPSHSKTLARTVKLEEDKKVVPLHHRICSPFKKSQSVVHRQVNSHVRKPGLGFPVNSFGPKSQKSPNNVHSEVTVIESDSDEVQVVDPSDCSDDDESDSDDLDGSSDVSCSGESEHSIHTVQDSDSESPMPSPSSGAINSSDYDSSIESYDEDEEMNSDSPPLPINVKIANYSISDKVHTNPHSKLYGSHVPPINVTPCDDPFADVLTVEDSNSSASNNVGSVATDKKTFDNISTGEESVSTDIAATIPTTANDSSDSIQKTDLED